MFPGARFQYGFHQILVAVKTFKQHRDLRQNFLFTRGEYGAGLAANSHPQFLIQVHLRGEVAVDGARAHAGPGCDRFMREGLIAVPDQQVVRGFQDVVSDGHGPFLPDRFLMTRFHGSKLPHKAVYCQR